MFGSSRGGVRGGQDQFNWEDVKTDKQRENYLGNSLMAPVGRWQKGRDLTWYAKDRAPCAGPSREEELAAVREAEREALLAALTSWRSANGKEATLRRRAWTGCWAWAVPVAPQAVWHYPGKTKRLPSLGCQCSRTTAWTAKAQAQPHLLPERSPVLRTRPNWIQRALRKVRKKRNTRRRNTRNTRRRKTKNTKGRLTAAHHLPPLLGPDTRDMILTSPPALRGSGDIARTVEGAHPANDKTEALMTENVARPKDTRSPGCPELRPCPPPSFVGSIKSSHWMPSDYQPPPYLLKLTIPIPVWDNAGGRILNQACWTLGSISPFGGNLCGNHSRQLRNGVLGDQRLVVL
ncbi:multiple myeloma tumor-associated protein 2 isoform X2 [Peromyscus californicus insignis]|uniref:multiple myeloma tumor-associated protein 2 isoform X2 n=1 Tax=Peromyscus californicus insignis TaxID=564181 RepID=UPI0022A7F239|nr:multiple myeloma tumor-associated protein 2 isoform X2 [Peromyscus californicus insignis]